MTKTLDKIVDILHSFTKSNIDDVSPIVSGDLQIIKDATGYKWLAIYSNSFRDEDATPEIISSKSQKAFVDNVDAGNYNYPDLLLWHNPRWKFGKATTVAYDEVEPGVVFAIAGGTIDVGKEYVADALLESGIKWKMSHGMPASGINREFLDGTVYAKHITTEITVLPAQFAANPLTGFGLVGDDTMISNKKKAEIVGELGIGVDVLTRLEASNKAVTLAEKDTREFKEINTVDEQTEVVEEVTQAEDVASVTETVTEEVVDQVQESPADPEFDIQSILNDNKDNVAAITTDIAEIKSALDVVVGAIETLSIAQKNVSERVDVVEKAKEDEVAAQTPAYSVAFKDRIDSIVGNPATEVKEEKDSESFTGPAEEKAVVKKQFGSEFLGSLVAASRAQ